MSRNVLVVEDDRDTARMFATYLEELGFTVVPAHDGDAGLAAFAQQPFELVIVDRNLPGKDGLHVTSSLRALPASRDLGIVMVTAGFKTPQANAQAQAAGADALLTTPLVLNDLKKTVATLLRARGLLMPELELAELEPMAPTGEFHPIPLLPVEAAVSSPSDVARALLECARARLSGVVSFSDSGSKLSIAFLHGVIVGASDNLREQLLGERLWKQKQLTTEQMRVLNARMAEKNERVAEALLALGYCGAEAALALVGEQLHARVRRALLWTGMLTVVEDEAEALKRAMEPKELLDVILSFALEPAQREEAASFVASHEDDRIAPSRGFDEVLLAFARICPEGALPSAVLGGALTVGAVALSSSPAEVWAGWLSGMLSLPNDPPHDGRSLPTTLRVSSSTALVDRAAVAEVCTWLLKARGKDARALFSLPREAPAADVNTRIDALLAHLGEFTAQALGPATSAARELRSLLEEHRRGLDADHSALMQAFLAAPTAAAPEDAFLEGQEHVNSGDLAAAKACFERALAAKSNDPEYASWLGWTELLTDDKSGLARLSATAKQYPQAMRPMFFLALHAQREGDLLKAKVLLQECLRRSPHDVEVTVALGLLS